MKTVWIITRSINEYNQDGQYADGPVYFQKPTLSALGRDLKSQDIDFLIAVWHGEGKLGDSESYHLEQIELADSTAKETITIGKRQ